MSHSQFEHNLFNVNGPTGTTYELSRDLNISFSEYDQQDTLDRLQKTGHEIVMSALEPRVINADSGMVVTRGIVKVLPALRAEEIDILKHDGIKAAPVLH